MIRYCAILIILTIVGSCTSNAPKVVSFDKEQEIVFNDIENDEIIAFSLQLKKYKDVLLVNDWREDSIINVFDLHTNHFQYNIAAIGNGPKELSNPTLLQLENDKLYLYETRKFRMYAIPLDSLAYKTQAMNKLFDLDSQTQRAYALSDSLFVSTGIFEPRFALLNGEGSKVGEFGEYPDLWKQEIDFPISAKAMFHQSSFVKQPNHSRFAFVSSHVLEIYSYDAKKPVKPILEHQILLDNYSYHYNTGKYTSAKADKNIARGVVDLAKSSKYIYALFKLGSEQSPKLGYKIMVFNWQGKPIMTYHTQEELRKICIDEQENRAYCTILKPEESIVYFDL